MSSGGGPSDSDPRPAAKPVAPKKRGGDGGGSAGSNECDIVERTNVNSPDRTVRATLRTNDVLGVEYVAGPPKKLLVKTSSGATLGSITSASMAQIIQCILAGYKYEAIVLSISGGLIEVQVQPK